MVDDEGIKSAMERCWNENSYLLCPRTATAAKYHYDHKYANIITLRKLRITSDEIIRSVKSLSSWGMFTPTSLCGMATGRHIISNLDSIAVYQIFSIKFCRAAIKSRTERLI